MRHRKRGRHLSRTASHRGALRRNMANSLFTYGRIVTTLEKAKEVRSFVEKIITKAKKGIMIKDKDRGIYLHYYRQVLMKLQNKELVKKLFGEGKWRENGGFAAQYTKRNGGYTRILRLAGSRLGIVSGSTAGKIPELKYKIFDVERKLKLIGNRLGDNATRVIFELVEGDSDIRKGKEETKPTITEEKKKSVG